MSLEIPASSMTAAPDSRSIQPPVVRTPPIDGRDDPAPENGRHELKPAAVVNWHSTGRGLE
jgi:hypothetical protein